MHGYPRSGAAQLDFRTAFLVVQIAASGYRENVVDQELPARRPAKTGCWALRWPGPDSGAQGGLIFLPWNSSNAQAKPVLEHDIKMAPRYQVWLQGDLVR